MAVGKSTVGRTLARLLKWQFIDLDCEIECRSGLSVRDIFTQQGEARFREMEAQALRLVVEGAAHATVVALGGGTFVQPQNADLLAQAGAHVVFLELPVNELLQRCRTTEARTAHNPRPLAEDEDAFCALYAQRLPFYRQAEMAVNTTDKTPEQISREIAASLGLSAYASVSD